jgi:acetyl esterase
MGSNSQVEDLTPEAAALLESIRAQGFPGWAFLTVSQMRAMMSGFKALAGEPPFAGQVQDITLWRDPEVTARVYRPDRTTPVPVLVYLHGGGFIAGDAEAYDGVVRRLASHAQAAVVSVNYRLAPEHKFPAALDDAFSAVQWTAENASRYGWSADRVAVGGDSAGATLAAAVCLRSRERGGPAIALQLLVYPVLDDDFTTDSYRRFGESLTLTQRDIQWFHSHYVNAADELHRPDVSPLRATDLRGLPPALIIAAATDPLRDDAVRYAERLRANGVKVELRVFDKMPHGFWLAPAVLPEGEEAIRIAATRLRTL